jgi:hypothetical protein
MNNTRKTKRSKKVSKKMSKKRTISNGLISEVRFFDSDVTDKDKIENMKYKYTLEWIKTYIV